MINKADIVIGVAYGDEGKGKITALLASSGHYDYVARWAGGNNAGHTVWVNDKKYKTHLVPSGVFYGVKSIVGPGCVLHIESFQAELDYLSENGFDTSLVKVSPKCHIVTDEHISYDKRYLAAKLGTTSRGIAPCYSDKAARTGILAKDVLDKELLWDEKLSGNILCEGAQGVWLDIDHGNYPYVTSSITLPYGACSIGFPPQKINKIWGAAKLYDTRSGEDPLFPESLLHDSELAAIAKLGEEFGVTTGRPRKVNWLNLTMLVDSINLTGATNLIINKCDIIKELGTHRLYQNDLLISFVVFKDMLAYIEAEVRQSCPLIEEIKFSFSPKEI